MTKITIDLLDEYPIKRSGGICIVKTADIPTVTWQNGIEMFLGNKIGDAAAPAKEKAGYQGMDNDDLSESQLAEIAKVAKTRMEAVLATLVAGEWSQRRESNIDPLAVHIRAVIRTNLSVNNKAAYKAIDAKARDTWLDDMYAGLDKAKSAAVLASATARKAKDDARKAEDKAEAKAAPALQI